MVRLGANEPTLAKFRLLTRDDVKASTAILDPNIPGSSNIRLSWIWAMGPQLSRSAPEAIQECKPSCGYQSVLVLTVSKFSVYIGLGPEHKSKDGKKSCCLSNMRWNGPQDLFCTRPSNGRIGLRSLTSIRVPKHMLLGSHLNRGL